MKEKLKKIVYEYSKNARLTTKELGKKTGTSQQSAFYLIHSLKEKKIIKHELCIIDQLKLGYINTLVGFNFTVLDEKTRKSVIKRLKEDPAIISVEESKEGFDILTEFSTKNLGQFDQHHRSFIKEFNKEVTTAFIFPIISRFIFPKKYLKREKLLKQIVLFGDREYHQLNDIEKEVLESLVKNPTIKIIDIASEINTNIKAVTKAKKDLESKKIIKGYHTVFDHKKLGIHREIMFLRFTGAGLNEIQKFIEFCKQHQNIIEAIKIIGSSQAAIIIEDIKEIEIIREIRSTFPIQSYMMFKSEKIHKKSYLPIEEPQK